MSKVGKKIAEWDETDIIDKEIEYRLENWENDFDEKPDEDEAREFVYKDQDLFEREWEYFIEYLTEIIIKKNPNCYWKVIVNNFGWRSVNGHKYLYATSGQELLNKILPKTDCTFYIHNFGKGLAIQNYHHDSPIGNEWYYLKPISERTYERNN